VCGGFTHGVYLEDTAKGYVLLLRLPPLLARGGSSQRSGMLTGRETSLGGRLVAVRGSQAVTTMRQLLQRHGFVKVPSGFLCSATVCKMHSWAQGFTSQAALPHMQTAGGTRVGGGLVQGHSRSALPTRVGGIHSSSIGTRSSNGVLRYADAYGLIGGSRAKQGLLGALSAKPRVPQSNPFLCLAKPQHESSPEPESASGNLTGMEVKRWLLLSMAYEGRRGYQNAHGSSMLFSEFLVQCLTALEKVTGSTSMLQSEKRQGLNRKVVKYLNFARSYQSISTTRRQRLCEDIADMFGERDTFISATQSGISPDIAIATAGALERTSARAGQTSFQRPQDKSSGPPRVPFDGQLARSMSTQSRPMEPGKSAQKEVSNGGAPSLDATSAEVSGLSPDYHESCDGSGFRRVRRHGQREHTHEFDRAHGTDSQDKSSNMFSTEPEPSAWKRSPRDVPSSGGESIQSTRQTFTQTSFPTRRAASPASELDGHSPVSSAPASERAVIDREQQPSTELPLEGETSTVTAAEPFRWEVGEERIDPSSAAVSDTLYAQRTTLGLGKGDIGWEQIVTIPPTLFAFDLETTGLYKRSGRRVTEIGVVSMATGATFRSFINPQMPIPADVSAVTHIYDDDVKDAPIFSEIIPRVIQFVEKETRDHHAKWEKTKGDTLGDGAHRGLDTWDNATQRYPLLLAHNGRSFDVPVLEEEFELCHSQMPEHWKFADTLSFARQALPFKATSLRGYKLSHLRKACGVATGAEHRALDDALDLNEVVKCLLERITQKTVGTTEERIDAARRSLTSIQFSPKSVSLNQSDNVGDKLATGNDQSQMRNSNTSLRGEEPKGQRRARLSRPKSKKSGRFVDDHFLPPDAWPHGSFAQLASSAAPKYRQENSLLGITHFLNQSNFAPTTGDPLDDLSLLLGERKETAVPLLASIGERIRHLHDFPVKLQDADAIEQSAPEKRKRSQAGDVVDVTSAEVSVLTEGGLSKAIVKELKGKGYDTVWDVVSHHPKDYDYLYVLPEEMTDDMHESGVYCRARVEELSSIPSRGGRILHKVTLLDDYGRIWNTISFNLWDWKYATNTEVYVQAKLHNTPYAKDGEWALKSPVKLKSKVVEMYFKPGEDAIIPKYPQARNKFKSDKMTKSIAAALNLIRGGKFLSVEDPVPAEIREQHNLMSRKEALLAIHHPSVAVDVFRAMDYFAFENLFSHQLSLLFRHIEYQEPKSESDFEGCSIYSSALCEEFQKLLPYELTTSQNDALRQIMSDLTGPAPMLRLLQGDVGCGKTIVALLALVAVVDSGWQGCILVPTEVLAIQHFESFQRELQSLPEHRRPTVCLALSALPAKEKQDLEARVAAGEPVICVGTTALLSKKMQFKRLGLVVIDEQQKFGVQARAQLRTYNPTPHVLHMSATPIPRTLAMCQVGEQALSCIRGRPSGRPPITTTVVSSKEKRKAAYNKMRELVDAGGKGYIICHAIGGGERETPAAVERIFADIQNSGLLPGVRAGFLHGRLDSETKMRVSHEFADTSPESLQVLVASSVVEVGMDVPDASAMIIEGAEYFGLSQLHQIRGRVGRGSKESHCFLVPTFSHSLTEETAEETSREAAGGSRSSKKAARRAASKSKPSGQQQEDADDEDVNVFIDAILQRLRVLEESSDGFYIAEKDLATRGAGDTSSVVQSGSSDGILRTVMDYGPECVGLARKEAVHFLASCAEEGRQAAGSRAGGDASGSTAAVQAGGFSIFTPTLVALIHENMNVELK